MISDGRGARVLAPRSLLGGALLSAVCLLPVVGSLQFDGSMLALLSDSGIASVEHRQSTTMLRDAEITVRTVADDGLNESVRADIDRLSRTIADIGGVAAVRNHSSGPAGAGVAAAIGVLLEKPQDASTTYRIAKEIESLVDRSETRASLLVAGPAVAAMRLSETLSRLVPSLSAVATVIALVAAALSLRSLAGILLTALCIAVGMVWGVAAIALTGRPVTLVTAGLIPLLPLIGVAFPLYYLAEVQLRTSSAADAREAAGGALARVRIPLGVLAASVSLGALVHITGDFPAWRSFALFAFLGTFSMGAATLVVAPAGAATWLRLASSALSASSALRQSRRLEAIGAAVTRNGWVLALTGGALLAAAVFGLARFGNDTDLESLTRFPSGKTVSLQPADHQMWSVYLDGGEARMIGRLDTVPAIADLQRFIADQKGVIATHSVIDFIATPPVPGSAYQLPVSQEELDAALRIEAEAIAHLVDADFSTARILVRTEDLDSERFNSMRERIEAATRRSGWSRWLGRQTDFPRGVDVTPAGAMVEFHRHAPQLKSEVLYGLVAAAFLLLAIVSVQFLSGRVGMSVVILNLAAMVVAVGFPGWTGVVTNPVAAPLTTLLLGIAIGHTAYYFRALGADGRTLDCQTEALARVVQSAGRPLIYSVAALAIGFAALAATEIPGLRWFGVLGFVGISTAFVSNFLVLASRVLNARIITLAEFLSTRLGPIEELPLFAGMRPFQAKLVVLSGHVRQAAPREAIARRGEAGSELYLLLSGRAEIRKSADGPVLGSIQRGDVVGEMGLVRAARRSADVVAIEAFEYLVLDGDFLQRLRRQYPRTASILLFNLTRILSDRLELANERITVLENTG